MLKAYRIADNKIGARKAIETGTLTDRLEILETILRQRKDGADR